MSWIPYFSGDSKKVALKVALKESVIFLALLLALLLALKRARTTFSAKKSAINHIFAI